MDNGQQDDFDVLVAASVRLNQQLSTIDGFLGSGIGFDNNSKKIVFKVYAKSSAVHNIPKIFEGIDVVVERVENVAGYNTLC